MTLKIFSSSDYPDTSGNYGDCFLLINNKTATLYDCGSEEHAERVIECLNDHGINKVTVILSHNDGDHFNGIPHLIEKKKVDKLFTILLLKYKDELLEKLDDDRRNKESIGEAIKKLYDNIASLSEKVELRDVYEDESELPSEIRLVGPEKEYMLDAAAKGLDGSEGDTIDGETITNAASVQIQIEFGGGKVLLTGDCAVEAIPDGEKLSTYSYIQLPHHGKADNAQEIFDRVGSNNDIFYLVSDNTGNSNGGSDDLSKKGHQIKNTKDIGDIEIDSNSSVSNINKKTTYIPGRTLGV